MTSLTSSLIFVGCFILLWGASWIWHLRRNAGRTVKPKGRPTMFDVRQLIIKGNKDAAIQLYAEIFKTTRKEAKKNVDELEKHIQEKHQI